MRFVYMGTPDFAVEPLRALAKAGFDVAAVVTQPDKPKGRSKMLVPPPVKEAALDLSIPVYQPLSVREETFVSLLRRIAPDLIVVAAFGQIIPREILDLPRLGCINIHASLLPRYRGAAPIQRAVIDGERESGVTIMQMSPGLDTGDIISQVTVPVSPEETGGSLFDKLAVAGAELLIKTIPSILDGTAVRRPQPEKSPTPYAAMITKEMGLLDFTKSAEELERLVRGLNPWPCAYSFLNGKMLKIWKSKTESGGAGMEPGTVILLDEEGIHVACACGTLVLQEVQIEGKKRMPAGDFLRGYRLDAGMRLKNCREPGTVPRTK